MPYKLSLAILAFIVACTLKAQQKGYYRTPAIYKNTVVFTAEGDLWKYDISTGATARLTSDHGMETYPVISQDGERVVFNGQYQGVTELYEMSLHGGAPRRLTHDFGTVMAPIPSGFTGDGKILYRTNRYNLLPDQQLIKLDPVTLNHE